MLAEYKKSILVCIQTQTEGENFEISKSFLLFSSVAIYLNTLYSHFMHIIHNI